ncbi:MAG: hypothetical protein A3F72_18275 [Bacteroidetes bacterium RIFCSPLOWO2_12_FULL_35_15]|nr:MAG: hypothetical protein A3F72_18275 [Bacteroidetes bacterium RIFCSPLOWO2_12_FULL_35_15]
MKKLKLLPVLVIAACFLLMPACKKKSSDTPAPTPTPTPTSNPSFVWSENGGANKTTTSVTFSNTYNALTASGTSGTIQFFISTDTPGTYSLSSSSNVFMYGNGNYSASSGNIIVSSNANGKISGTFSTASTSGSITSVNGSFTDVPVQ